MSSKNSLGHTKLEILRSKLILLLLVLQLIISPCFAAKIIGDPSIKKNAFISRMYSEHYTISRDNTVDFYYTYKDGTEKDFEDIPVFPNGTMIIPHLGEHTVFGLTVAELETMIIENSDRVEKAEIFIKRVPNNFSVLGEVKNPGSFKLEDVKTIYDGIAKAEGFTQVAKKSKVKLVRQREDGSRYTYVINFPKEVFKAYAEGSGIGREAYLLEEGDLIYVDGSIAKKTWKIFKTAMSAATLGVFAGVTSALID